MIKINFSKNSKDTVVPDNAKKLIRTACKKVLETENFLDSAEINVTFVTDEEIREINNSFRQIDKATDVLSFPLGENGIYDKNPENDCLMLGDVVISVEHAIMQAEEFGHSVEREIAYLTVHSVLHLLGYDHILEGDDKKLMRQREETALEKMGLKIKGR